MKDNEKSRKDREGAVPLGDVPRTKRNEYNKKGIHGKKMTNTEIYARIQSNGKINHGRDDEKKYFSPDFFVAKSGIQQRQTAKKQERHR